jgi:serine/threonine protein kinase
MANDLDSRCDTKILPPRLATGQMVKHFQLESLLGEGGMGVVYRAYDTQLCRPVAVKVLHSVLTAEPDRKQRFLQEARAAARINHPAVAQIFYVDEQDGIAFLVMELVEGKTLRDVIQTGGLDLLGVTDIIIEAAEALAKAHDLGIVHRDIKPANVMVTHDGHVKILDFGLAKLLDPATTAKGSDTSLALTPLPGVVMGTAAYMSPEQVRSAPVDGRSDIFSLGILLFEMVTGQSPFQRTSFVDSLHAVAFEEPPPITSLRDHLPPDLQRIISRCLQKRPEDRYPNARLLARDLRELRRNTEAGLTPRTPFRVRFMEHWEQFRRLSPIGYLRVVAILLALGFAIFYSLRQIGWAGALWLTAIGVLLYRRIRSSPQRVQELFVRRIAKIPEVRLITYHNRQFTVVVDRAVSQLYSRINEHIKVCNRKLYFGQPFTVSVLHSLAPEKIQELLAGPGVQYLRDDP